MLLEQGGPAHFETHQVEELLDREHAGLSHLVHMDRRVFFILSQFLLVARNQISYFLRGLTVQKLFFKRELKLFAFAANTVELCLLFRVLLV